MTETTLLEILSLRGGYQTTLVMVSVAFFGAVAAIVGAFCIWRRKALISDAMSHATLPGVCAAFLVMHYFGYQQKSFGLLLLGAAISALLGGLTVQWITRGTRLYGDTAIGVVLSVFFGVGVVLLSIIQNLGNAEQGGLSNFIYGQVATLHLSDAHALAFVSCTLLAVLAYFFHPLILTSFDEGYSNVIGINTRAMDLIILGAVVLTTVSGLIAIGLLLVLAVMIIPPVTARLWSQNYRTVIIIASVFGALACYIGAALSAVAADYPTGATIVLVSGVLFVFSLIFAPIGGVLPQWMRRLKFDWQIKQDHILRSLFEASELDIGKSSSSLFEGIGGKNPLNMLLIYRLRHHGYVRAHDGVWALSAMGGRNIENLIKGHRLWERYIIANTTLDELHAHDSADMVEHVLSEERIKTLAEELGDSVDNSSVHDLAVK